MKEWAHANKVKANRNSPRKAKRLLLMMRVHACRVTKLGAFNHGLQIIFFSLPTVKMFPSYH